MSNEITVITALKPATPNPPTVSTSGSNVIISWTVPSSNGSPITGYNIKLLNNLTGNYEEDESYCNGASTLSLITLQCSIPMANVVSRWNLPIGNFI